MTTTLANMYIGIAREAGMYISGTATGNGAAGGTTIVASALADYPDDDSRLLEAWAYITGTTSGCQYQTRPISSFTSSTGTITVRRAFGDQIDSGETFLVFPFSPTDMLAKINDAIRETRWLYQRIDSTAYATRQWVHQYPVPSTIVEDPLQIKISKEPFSTAIIHDCESAWDELTDGDATAILDDRDYQQGTSSMRWDIAAGMAAGDIIGTDSISSADLSDHAGVVLSIKSSVATTAGQLQLILSETASCGSEDELLSIPALVAGEWQRVYIDYSSTDTAAVGDARDAIISVGLKYTADLGACSVWVDNIQSVTRNPADTLADQDSWERLWNWYYVEGSSPKVYFPYSLPSNRKLLFIGKGYVASSDLSAVSDTVSCDEPDIKHLYALVLYMLYRDQYVRARGTEKDEIEKNMNFWERRAELLGQRLRLNLPPATIKRPEYMGPVECL